MYYTQKIESSIYIVTCRTGNYDYQTTVASMLAVARRAKTIFESSEVHEKEHF